MKWFFPVILLFVTSLLNAQNEFSLEGKIASAYQFDQVQLRLDVDRQKILEVPIINGTYRIEGQLEMPSRARMKFTGQKDTIYASLYIGHGKITADLLEVDYNGKVFRDYLNKKMELHNFESFNLKVDYELLDPIYTYLKDYKIALSEYWYKYKKAYKSKQEQDRLSEVFVSEMVAKLELQITEYAKIMVLSDLLGFVPLQTYADSFIPLITKLESQLEASYYGQKVFQKYTKLAKLELGQPSKKIDFVDINGETQQLSNYKGKTVLLEFWASWCGPCIAKMPALSKLQEKYRKEDFIILAISRDASENPWKKAIEKYQLDFVHTLDAKGVIAQKYNVTSLPNNYLIDSSGRIIGVNMKAEEIEDKLLSLKRENEFSIAGQVPLGYQFDSVQLFLDVDQAQHIKVPITDGSYHISSSLEAPTRANLKFTGQTAPIYAFLYIGENSKIEANLMEVDYQSKTFRDYIDNKMELNNFESSNLALTYEASDPIYIYVKAYKEKLSNYWYLHKNAFPSKKRQNKISEAFIDELIVQLQKPIDSYAKAMVLSDLLGFISLQPYVDRLQPIIEELVPELEGTYYGQKVRMKYSKLVKLN